MSFIGVYDYTVILTHISLLSSLAGILCAAQGRFSAALACLMFSGFCDMFDGIVARTKKNRTDIEKGFGIQLDSLCDVVCFGVFPALLLYFRGVQSIAGIAALFFYVLCAVIRLAYFNVLESKRQETEGGCAKEYRGLPVTTAAIIFPLAFLLNRSLANLVTGPLCDILPVAIPLAVGFLFILDFRVPKIDYVKLVQRRRAKADIEK